MRCCKFCIISSSNLIKILLFKNILLLIDTKINDIEFIIFLIIGICSFVIKKYITDSITQSENIFINTQKENLNNLNKIYFNLVQLSLEPNSKSKSKKLYKLLLKNSFILVKKENDDLLKNIYESYTSKKLLNEKLILDYIRNIQTKIKDINQIIETNNLKYLEYNSNPIWFYFKKILLSASLILFTISILYILRYCYIKIFT